MPRGVEQVDVRRLPAALAAVALSVLATSASALDPIPGTPGPGYFATDNLELVTTIPLNTDSAGARIVGKTLYITDDRGLTTYDISQPTAPARLGFLPVPQEPYVPEEDVDTNGKTLLIGTLQSLHVIDVRDPKNPKEVGALAGADAHTVSCVLDCQYAWLNTGRIVDLRNPEGPVVVGDWTKGAPVKSSHDVTEVSPGIVMTSSNPMVLFDARRSPSKPKILATASPGDKRFMHGNLWPRATKDRWLLAGGETSGTCEGETDGAFMVFDTAGWQKSKKMRMVDDYTVTTGLPNEGKNVVDQFCAHWFSTHPTYRDGGVVAMGWYEHGTRLLDVSRKNGKITEVGWFLPLAGSTSAAYWVDKTTLYAVDYQRGIDILKWNGKASKTTRAHGAAQGLTMRTLLPRVAPATGVNTYLCPIPTA
jgi:hypothetical protein